MREPSEIDVLTERYSLALAELSPTLATAIGVPGFDDQLEDLSPDGAARRAALSQDTLARLTTLTARDQVDRVTAAAMSDRLDVEVELFQAGEYRRDLNNIGSPAQGLRDVFDLMPTATGDDWAMIARRLKAMPAAVDGYIASLREGMDTGQMPARRQVTAGAVQAAELGDPASGFFGTFVAAARPDGAQPSQALAADLAAGVAAAAGAYRRLSGFLAGELAGRAPETDAVGRDRYALASRLFVGAAVDLDETYEWGLSELARISAEQEALAAGIAGPGASVADAVAVLDADPRYRLHGTGELQGWMQRTSDAAIEALDGVHFDLAPQLRTLECCIAPTTTGGIYYTGPSDDWSRPGRMWWSVPPEVTLFHTWREKTTVFHEGVPGHHLQIGTAVANAADLNLWRSQISWSSGHGEGWALYAEQLMAEFGFLDDPGDRFGLLDSQRLRATRVVLDIGLHLAKPALPEFGTGPWDADSTWRLLKANVNMDEGFLRFEHLRYLGWPGQAPSYAIGRRLWLQLRDAATASGMSLRDFHAKALALGSVPLAVLPEMLMR